jgi:hypothetical protein
MPAFFDLMTAPVSADPLQPIHFSYFPSGLRDPAQAYTALARFRSKPRSGSIQARTEPTIFE